MMNTFPNLPNILKETKNSQLNLEFSLNQAKKELEQQTKILNNEKEKLRNASMERSRVQRNLCSLDSLLPNLKATVSDIEQKNKELVQKIDQISWKQTKADFISSSEKKLCEKKQVQLNKFINDKEKAIFGDNDKEGEKKQKEMIKELCEKRDELSAELEEMTNHSAEMNDLIQQVEQENKILQKRNSALLLRFQSLLREKESRRNNLLDKLKQEKIINNY
ncbi:hypothetical protein J437_LFUL000306 [Ladona fulva]|uniref:Uncharacterized protein n=1 Tax=Ladona fulva TaxID=123851 RepID=A0A8K0NYR0_LADFU|nr:hypothetical protein J437_LFUL000306 [Ladona fulva]